LTNNYTAPLLDEPVVDEKGKQNDPLFLFLDFVSKYVNGDIPITPPSYTNLADINARLPLPNENNMVRVIGQGLAVFDGTNWVLASDDTTLII